MSKRLLNSSLAALSPQRETLLNTFNSIFDEVFNQNFLSTSPVQTELSHPKFNAYLRNPSNQTGSELVLDLSVPYVQREDIELEINESDNSLCVNVRNHQDSEVKESDYYVRQLSRSSFRRIYNFDGMFPVKNAKADLKDGILRITIPSTLVYKPNTRKIKIG